MGGNGVWGGREYGALGTPRHTDLHFDPQATTFLSPPGGIYLIFQGGHNLVKFHLMKLKMTTSGPVPDNKRPRAS